MSIGPFNKEDRENDRRAAETAMFEANRSLRFALDTARAELRLKRFEVFQEFVNQVSSTGRITIKGDAENPDYTYDFHGSPWIEKDYIPKGLYAQKIAQLKKILSDCESLPEPPARS
jgi:hypothetical protein